ncbi:hypothetical protein RchiOBHm_Chr5g0048861 [Rosa chinensis]|uniref:Uncharacterized protein n=1 Tax=Rosa chinensis TaxID=74649 RepID=A0A2P6QEQ9_ROSCH|nr:hypothetical protein RchiOBHm_Chr5g0048861 [Rosa chinensis]
MILACFSVLGIKAFFCDCQSSFFSIAPFHFSLKSLSNFIVLWLRPNSFPV